MRRRRSTYYGVGLAHLQSSPAQISVNLAHPSGDVLRIMPYYGVSFTPVYGVSFTPV